MELEEDWEEVLMDDEMEDENCNKSMTQFSCETCQFTTTTRFALNKHQLKHSTDQYSSIPHESDDSDQEIVLEEEIFHDSDLDSIPDIEEYEIDNDDLATEDVDEEHNIPDLQKLENKDLPPYTLPKEEFTCDICDYSSKLSVNVKRHLENRIKNGSMEPFQCDLCLYRNCNKKGIHRHKSIHIKPSKYYDYEPVPVMPVLPPEEPIKMQEQPESSSNSNLSLRKAIFECSFCSFKAKTRFALTRHIQNHGNIQPDDEFELVPHQRGNKYERNAAMDWNENTCEYCDFSTLDQKRMDNHLRKRLLSRDGPVKCDICGYTSCTKVGLNMHVSRKHQGKPIKVRNKEIVRTSSGPRVQEHRYTCDHCDFKAITEKRLDNHLKRRSVCNYDPVYCQVCGYKSCTKPGLAMHFQRKHGNIPNPSSSNNSQKLDVSITTTPKLTKAQDINQIPYVLKISKNSNKGNKNHACFKCDYKTNNRTDLENHLKASTNIETPRNCEKCSETRCTYHGLLTHYRLDHGHRKGGDQKFSKSDQKLKKLKKHDSLFYCDQCDFRSKYHPNLDRHRKNLHPKVQENKILEKVYFVLPRPKKGVWIVPLEKIDPDDIEYMTFD